jgi:HTH-type transcriptional regulator, global nitrogen regulator NrpRI
MFAFERIGFAANRIDNLTFLTSLDPVTGKGEVILNITCVPESRKEDLFNLLGIALNSAYAMSNRIVVRRTGETLGPLTVPERTVAIGTVCSITLNGILERAGVRVSSKFGGIVEIIDNVPTRFLSVISYEGSSVAPLEIFMASRMTDILGALQYGTGRILAGFREIPETSIEGAKRAVRKLEKTGLRGNVLFGNPGEPLLGVPVAPHKAGMVVLGGLNPIAALVEAGIAEETLTMASLYEYSDMSPLANPMEGPFPFSRPAMIGLPDRPAVGDIRPLTGYWSVFEGSKQSTL